MPIFTGARQRWILLALTVFTFFFLLGSRALNEPDEGRYAEIGREMAATGDFLTPRFNGVIHLAKPPLTYWAIAGGMALVGPNEWGLRLYNAVALVILVLAVARLGAVLWDAAAGRVAGLMFNFFQMLSMCCLEGVGYK